jgi:hypothetical protein
VTVIRDEVLQQIPDGRLKVFIIWEAILPKDDIGALDDATLLLKDEWRALQFWDPTAQSGKRVKKLFDLRIKNPAWDTYMLYAPGTKWTDGDPPLPAFWMHQLTFVPGSEDAQRYESHRLDTTRLREEVRKLIGR